MKKKTLQETIKGIGKVSGKIMRVPDPVKKDPILVELRAIRSLLERLVEIEGAPRAKKV